MVLTLCFTVGTAAVSSNTSDGLKSHGLRLARQTRLKVKKQSRVTLPSTENVQSDVFKRLVLSDQQSKEIHFTKILKTQRVSVVDREAKLTVSRFSLMKMRLNMTETIWTFDLRTKIKHI